MLCPSKECLSAYTYSTPIVKGLDFHHYIAFPEKMLTAEQTLENIKSLFTAYLEKEPSNT
jgi:hypothetical protein